MSKSTNAKRKSFSLYAAATALLTGIGTLAAVLSGVSPAQAADIAHQPDTQVAVFMVPLTLLVLTVLFEVTRTVMRGNLPVEAPATRSTDRYWSPGQSDS